MGRGVWFLFFLFSQAAFAANELSLGRVADNITEPIQVVSAFVSVGCLIVGVACLFATVVKYFEHRRSPLHVPISTVVWLLIIGLLLLFLPFAYIITENGIPFSTLWGGVE
jgi:RsiW-degrading membrane proteinase PrsW (M82 family)